MGLARRLVRVLIAAFSVLVLLCLSLAFAVFLALGTETGRSLVRERTEAVVGEVLGPDYSVELSGQRLTVEPEATLVLEWNDVRLTRRNSVGSQSRVARIRAGLRLLPLLAGRVEFARLAVDGATIDLAGLSAAPDAAPKVQAAAGEPDIPAMLDAGVAAFVDHVRTLQDLNFEAINLSNITIAGADDRSGGPPLGIESLSLSRASGNAMRLAGRVTVGPATIPVGGEMNLEGASGDLEAAKVAVGPVDLGKLLPSTGKDGSRAPFATDASARVSIAIGPAAEGGGGRSVTLVADLGKGALALGRSHTKVESARIAISHRQGERSIGIESSPLHFDGLDMNLEGRLVARDDGDTAGGIGGYDFDLLAKDMRSTIGSPSGRPQVASLRIAGRSDSRAERISVSELSLKTETGSLSGTAALGYGSGDAPAFLHLKGATLGAAAVKAFWPFMIATNTREWVIQHIGDAGRVPQASIALDLDLKRLQDVLDAKADPAPDELTVAVDIEEADLSTFGKLPGLLRARGHILTKGADTEVTVETAKVEGLPKIDLQRSTLNFVKQTMEDVRADLTLALDGDLPQLLSVAARDPIDAFKDMDIAPADLTGSGTADVNASILLGDDVSKEEQLLSWSVSVGLEDASIQKPIEGRQLTALNGPIDVEPGQASGDLRGKVDGIPASISFVEPFGSKPKGKKSLEVEASLSAAETAKALPFLDGIVQGPLKATLAKSDEGFKADVDLSQARLTVPVIGWTKGAEVSSDLQFEIVETPGGTTLRNAVLKGSGFEVEGTVHFDDAGLTGVALDRLALNPGDDVSLKVDRVSNGYSIRAKGARFDARPILKSLHASAEGTGKPANAAVRTQVDVGVAVDRLIGFDGEEIHGFNLNYAGRGDSISALSLSGQLRQGASVTADFSPRDAQRSISLATGDVGDLLKFAGLYKRMDGGKGSLKLLGAKGTPYRGTIVLQNFTLVDEPRLSSLVTATPVPKAPSLSQALGRPLTTEKVFFDHASAKLKYGDDALVVDDGILRGPVFGASFSGTVYDASGRMDMAGSFMPAYGVNRIFGAIPFLGTILGNGNEGGLIGITYRLAGSFDSPTLTVNPISAIAPGIFRRIFAYQ